MSQEIQSQDIFFALDIGTRSVIGVIGTIADDEIVNILDIESVEHPKRAMIDGQIEDIVQVSKIAKLVKTRLEERNGCVLTRVNVAAAGRSLKTCHSSGEIELNHDSVIDTATVRTLETDAINKANKVVIDEQGAGHSQFFCVGYSVMKYFLDDYPISTLLGHKGDNCRVEMIVTFLPNEVVESLYSAMNSIDLQVESLTLEPIAAMNAVIPQELRSLNLALVDIGAGTSDIAISNNGSVVAYAMATVAGDEITEILSKKYIVDFDTAEKMKHDLSANTADITFSDILGNDYAVAATEIFETIKPALEHLCNVVCDRILDVNDVSPAAVFLVGGASKIPYLCSLVAERLNIDQKRVAVGGNKPLKKTVISELDIFNPEYVTPIGILITAAKSATADDLVVTVNGERFTIFHRSGVTVMDLLLSSGYRYSQMLGTSGKNLIFTLNGEKKIMRGGYPIPANISVNGQPASFFMPINGGDNIIIEPAISGEDATAFVRDIVTGSYELDITLSGKPFTVGTRIMRGEIPLNASDKIYQNDVIDTAELRNVFDLCDYSNLNIDEYAFTANDQPINGGYTFKAGDSIRYTKKPDITVPDDEQVRLLSQDGVSNNETVEQTKFEATSEVYSSPVTKANDSDFSESMTTNQSIDSDNEPIVQPAKNTRTLEEINTLLMHQRVAVGVEVAPKNEFSIAIKVTLNSKTVELEPKVDGTPYLFFDMLNLVNIDPSKPQGNIILNHNGDDASFMTPVKDGDIIDIYWDQQI